MFYNITIFYAFIREHIFCHQLSNQGMIAVDNKNASKEINQTEEHFNNNTVKPLNSAHSRDHTNCSLVGGYLKKMNKN